MARRYIRPRLVDLSGNTLQGGWLRVLEAGTNTEVDLFAAESGGSALTQPRTTDARGEVEVWLADGTGDVDLEWSDSGETRIAATGRRITFGTFTEFTSAPPGGGGAATHAGLPDLATSGHPASVIANTPSGSVAATTVQAAIDELDSEKAAKAANLSDLASAASARTNLGLGDAATKNVGTGAGTVAAGDDSRITGALSVVTAAATYQPLDSDLTAIAALSTTAFGRALLTMADATALRVAAGLGTAATKDTGTGPTNVIVGDDARLSDARSPSGSAGGDLTGSYPNPTLGTSGVAAGSYGSGSAIPVLTVDAKGRVTGATTSAVTPASPTLARGSLGSMIYNLPGVQISNVSVSWGPAANRTYYMPVRVEAPLTLANLYLSVNGAVGSSHVAVGIFAADKALQPTGSPLFATSIIDTASTGTKTIAVSNYAWTPGVYLIALNASHGGIGFDVVNGRVPGVTGGWHSTSWLGTPSIISCGRTYDGTLTADAWDAVSSGAYGINYAVTCGYTVT